jgi:predicted acetyltransferase
MRFWGSYFIKPESAMEKQEYTIRGGVPSDFESMAQLTEMVFKDSFVRNVITKEEGFNYKNARLLFDETGKLASTVFVIPRDMYMDGIILKLGGIGGVATDPVHRGKGYANLLMKDAVDFMEKEKYDLSVLYPFKPEYYAKFGYRNFIVPFKVLDTSKPPEAKGGYAVREYKSTDIKQLMKIYEDFSADKTGPVKRKLTYWEQYVEKNAVIREGFFVAEKEGKIAGYVILDRIRANWGVPEFCYKITEFACAKEHAPALCALAAHSAACVAGKGFKKLFIEGAAGFPPRAPRPRPKRIRKSTGI